MNANGPNLIYEIAYWHALMITSSARQQHFEFKSQREHTSDELEQVTLVMSLNRPVRHILISSGDLVETSTKDTRHKNGIRGLQ